MRLDYEAGQSVAPLQRATKGQPGAKAGQSNQASAVGFWQFSAQRNVRANTLASRML